VAVTEGNTVEATKPYIIQVDDLDRYSAASVLEDLRSDGLALDDSYGVVQIAARTFVARGYLKSKEAEALAARDHVQVFAELGIEPM
jgi:hypothetical protein